MSEQIQTPPEIVPEDSLKPVDRQVADKFFDGLAAEGLSEFQDPNKLQAAKEAAADLIKRTKLQPEFFENGGRAVVFAGLAHLQASHSDSDRYGQRFAYKSLLELGKTFIDESLSQKKEKLADEEELQVFKKYQNTELTSMLEEYLETSGVLTETHRSLGVTPDTEEPFEVLDLDIADGYTWAGIGVDIPEIDDYDDSESFDDPAFKEAVQKAAELREDESRLEQNLAQMAAELQQDGFPPACVVQLNGKKYYVFQNPTARKLMQRVSTTSYYDGYNAEADQAFLQHEYVHTQRFKGLGYNTVMGITLEEVRAEELSGNKHGYDDAKTFLEEFSVITGADMYGLLESNATKPDAGDIYLELAKKAGLEVMTEVALVLPNAYAKRKNEPNMTDIQTRIGGYASIISRLESQAPNDEAAVRIRDYSEHKVRQIREINQRDRKEGGRFIMTPELWANYFNYGPELSGLKKEVIRLYREKYGPEPEEDQVG